MLEERGDKHGADSTLDKHVTDADGLAVTSAARRCEKFKDKLYFFCVGLFFGGVFALCVCPTIVKQFLASFPRGRGGEGTGTWGDGRVGGRAH